MPKFVVGIDEAGRGPLAGPVSVGAVAVPSDFDLSLLKGVRDSKQLSGDEREEWFQKLPLLQEHGLMWNVQFSSAHMIDTNGIVRAIRDALYRALEALELDPRTVHILLDGSLYAPKEYVFQRTIIKGDQTEPLISLASIAAKVERDRHMIKLAKKYPLYKFDVHKGYGTKLHREALMQFGPCHIHRRTFCKLDEVRKK